MKRYVVALLLFSLTFGVILPSMPATPTEASAAIAAKADRQQRRVERRMACEIFRLTADDLGISRLALARRLKANDAEAWAALAAVKASEYPQSDIDWEALIELIMAIVELLLKLFADATAYQPMFCVAPPAIEAPQVLKLPTPHWPLPTAA